jgi:hypothetical protein
MSRTNDTRYQAQRGEILATGKRFCTGCSTTQDARYGVQRPNRWVCIHCIKRAREQMRKKDE